MYLTMAIVAEVIATTMLKASEGFTRLWPSLLVVLGYGVAFWGLSMVVKSGFVNGMVASHLLCHSGTINRHSLNGALLS